MLKRRRGSGRLRPVSGLRGENIQSFVTNCDVRIFRISFYQMEEVPFTSQFVESRYHEWMSHCEFRPPVFLHRLRGSIIRFFFNLLLW